MARARYARVITHAVTGLEGLGSIPEDAIREAEATGVPFQLANAYTGMLAVESARDKALAPPLFAKARQWAELAGTRLLFDNAALWMALACRDEEPLQTLAFLRLCVADTHARRYWGNFEMILRPVVPALVRLGRHRPAAIILGGLLGLAGGRTESIALATELPRSAHRCARRRARLTAPRRPAARPSELGTAHDQRSRLAHQHVGAGSDEIGQDDASTRASRRPGLR